MRIEYQGTIEARPPFQHVGYTAAGLLERHSVTAVRGSVFAAVVVALTLLVALMSRRERRTPRLCAAAAVAGCVLLAAGAWSFTTHNRYSLTPPYAKTLLDMERLIVRTDALCRQLGHTPSAAEWERGFGGERDGWGEPYFYAPAARDRWPTELGRDYMICSFRGRGSEPGEHDPFHFSTSIQSAWLGPDGVVGTADDHGMMPGRQELHAGAGRAGLERLAAQVASGGEPRREPPAPAVNSAETRAGGDG